MISKPDLKFLIIRYLKDAEALLNNRRYASAIYLAGYALELALKYRICKIMIFSRGFPENKNEFDKYFSDTKKTLMRSAIRELRDIRHHELRRLLHYSGEDHNVHANFSVEWNIVNGWSPEMRYKTTIVRKAKCEIFFNAAGRLINYIISINL
jgi:AbiV family abortive infection protein